MPDVAYLRNRQGWNFKALNDKARKAMGESVGGPWQMAADVFFSGVPDGNFDKMVQKLRAMGLDVPDRQETPKAKPVDVSKFLA